jgi:hypothetical protein
MQRSCKYDGFATEGGGVGQAAVGESHEITYVDLPPIFAQPKGNLLSATMFKRLKRTQNMSTLFETCTVGRAFSMRIERTYSGVQTPTNIFSVNCFNFRVTPVKLSRSAKQHPSKSAHLMRRFVRGLSIYYVDQFFIPTNLHA